MRLPIGIPLTAALLALLAVPTISSSQGTRASVPAERYAARRERAYSRLGNDLLVIRSRWAPGLFTQPAFDQDPTFYYLTGADHVLGAILVLDGKTRRAELFLPTTLPRSLGPIGRTQPRPGVARADSFHVDSVGDWHGFSRYVEQRLRDEPRPTMHVDEEVTQGGLTGFVDIALDSAATLGRPPSVWGEALKRRWPDASIVTSTAISSELRVVKDSVEVAALRRAATNSVDALRAGMLRVAPGRHQRDVEGAVVDACTRNAGDGPSFWPWAMSGPNAVFPTPFTSSVDMHNLDRVMRPGEVVRLDIGCQVDHYMGDVGRTVPVSGRFTPDQAEVIDLLVATYRAGLATLRDGVADSTVVQASMAEARRLRPAMRTALGRHAAALISDRDSIPFWQLHGIGLDIAEPLPTVLRSGMVLDYEPIFAVDGHGFYMEDMILITPTGYEILTKGLPYSAAEIERAMRPRAVR